MAILFLFIVLFWLFIVVMLVTNKRGYKPRNNDGNYNTKRPTRHKLYRKPGDKR